jgi:hypothetical protein
MTTSLRGLPDLASPIVVGGALVYLPYDQGTPPALFGPYLVAPDALEVARRDDGTPELTLTTYRGADPTRPPAPYGQLELRLAVRTPTAAARAGLRATDPRATAIGARLAGGFLRMAPLVGGEALPPELAQPIALGWDGLGVARLWLRLRLDSAVWLERALGAGTLLATADVQLEFDGVAPRLPVTVAFDPRGLVDELAARADAGVIEREQVVAHLLATIDGWLVARPTPPIDPAVIAAALADHVRARFGAPAMGAPGRAAMRLVNPTSIDHGRFVWDLATPIVAPRVIALTLDPFAAAQAVMAARGIDAVARSVVVPPLPTGALAVTVDVNLPARPEGLLGILVDLDAPPAPPRRLQAARVTVELTAAAPAATAVLRLAADEAPAYFYRVSAVIAGATGIDQRQGARTPHEGPTLGLSLADLPLTLVPVAAEAALLALGDVEVTLRWSRDGAAHQQQARLTAAAPALSLLLLHGAADPTIAIALCERGGPGRVELPARPAAAMQLGLHAFATSGPQQLALEARFGAAPAPIAVEVWPNDRALGPAGPGAEAGPPPLTAALTAAAPAKVVSWIARSPFAPGAWWRWRALAGEGAASRWQLAVEPAVTIVVAAPEETTMTFDDVVVEADPAAADRYRAWPRRPRPERGPGGRPTLLLMAGTTRGALQLGVHWDLDDSELDEVLGRLAAGRPAGAPPPQVERALLADVEAALFVRDDAASPPVEVELGRRPSSGAPPWTALFSLRLDAGQLARVRRTLAGERGLVRAVYRGWLPRPVTVTALIAGDAAEDVAALIGAATIEAAAARVEAALAAGRLTLTAPAADAPAALRDELIAQARAAAATLLCSIATGAELAANPAALRVEVTRSASLPRPVEAEADLADWFAGADPSPHLIELPAGVDP